jgi:hypothetical protein
MGTITVTIKEEAESFLRGKNECKGDMGRYLSGLLFQAEEKEKWLDRNKQTDEEYYEFCWSEHERETAEATKALAESTFQKQKAP